MKLNHLIRKLTVSVLLLVFVANSFAFPVSIHSIDVSSETPEYEAIDLGLPSGVKWGVSGYSRLVDSQNQE